MLLMQAADFGAESEVLHDLIDTLSPEDWARPTGFKGWTVRDVIAHLHFWNRAADLSLHDEAAFHALFARVADGLKQGRLRAAEDAIMEDGAPRMEGRDLAEHWIQLARDIAGRWTHADPKARVAWAGPSMSVRSSITARHMETWAHGHEIFDLFAEAREDTDRIRNIVVLGVNTYGWTHKLHDRAAPDTMPKLALTAPSGAVWEYGDDAGGRIEGSAVSFAQTVTQTRNWRDTDLKATGDTANWWMEHAQCFAGQPETPPAPGTRKRAAKRPD
jgi:uncharacterized protein (TIGR03084 family)